MSTSIATEPLNDSDSSLELQSQHGRHADPSSRRWRNALAVVIAIIVVAAVAVGAYLVGSHVNEVHAAQTIHDQASTNYDKGYQDGYFDGNVQGKWYAQVTTSPVAAVAKPSDKTGTAMMVLDKEYGANVVWFSGIPSDVNSINLVLASGVKPARETCEPYRISVDYTTNQITAIVPVSTPVALQQAIPMWSSCFTH